MPWLVGRCRSEVLNLTAGDIEPGEPPLYRYRGKGGKRERRKAGRPKQIPHRSPGIVRLGTPPALIRRSRPALVSILALERRVAWTS